MTMTNASMTIISKSVWWGRLIQGGARLTGLGATRPRPQLAGLRAARHPAPLGQPRALAARIGALSASVRCASQDGRSSGAGLAAADVEKLPPGVLAYVQDAIALCKPAAVHLCDGTDAENKSLLQQLEANGVLTKLAKR